jgi:hypothetical protein
MYTATDMRNPPYTEAVRKALQTVQDSLSVADLLFLEAWEMQPSSDLGATLRASQIRRANRELTAEINAELKTAWRAKRSVVS